MFGRIMKVSGNKVHMKVKERKDNIDVYPATLPCTSDVIDQIFRDCLFEKQIVFSVVSGNVTYVKEV